MSLSFLGVFSLLTSGLCLALGFAVYILDRKARLNRLFMAILVFNAYWAFAEFMMFQADSVQTAYSGTESFFTIIPDSLILASLDGKIVRVNDALLKVSGFSKKEVIGRNFVEMFTDPKVGKNILVRLLKEGEIKNFETQFKTKTGELTVLFSGSAVKRKNGAVIGFTCIVHDITERKEMEKKLVNAERFASIGELAGMVGHDLRNPLSSMGGATYYLKTRYADKLDVKGNDMLTT